MTSGRYVIPRGARWEVLSPDGRLVGSYATRASAERIAAYKRLPPPSFLRMRDPLPPGVSYRAGR